jgi:hypothetical protein
LDLFDRASIACISLGKTSRIALSTDSMQRLESLVLKRFQLAIQMTRQDIVRRGEKSYGSKWVPYE